MTKHILQRLYDNEINFSLSCFYDAGFEVKLGDKLNGFKAEAEVEGLDKALVWLRKQAIMYYPYSDFAKEENPEWTISTVKKLKGAMLEWRGKNENMRLTEDTCVIINAGARIRIDEHEPGILAFKCYGPETHMNFLYHYSVLAEALNDGLWKVLE